MNDEQNDKPRITIAINIDPPDAPAERVAAMVAERLARLPAFKSAAKDER